MAITTKPVSNLRIRLLADFRHQLRLFLQFSEKAAARFELHPQQHQLLLQIAGIPDGGQATVGYATERLGLRHNTVVELSKRSEEAGLLTRKQSADDRRRVILKLTPKGRAILRALSEDHARELNELAPQLIRALSALSSSAQREAKPMPGRKREG
jgi:DNA-binding MarR family transcriptional regulator